MEEGHVDDSSDTSGKKNGDQDECEELNGKVMFE